MASNGFSGAATWTALAEEGSPLSLRLAGRKRQLSDASADEPQPVSSKLKP